MLTDYERLRDLYGNMFPPQKVGQAIDRVAGDIREHFISILLGDDTECDRISRLLHTPTSKARLP